ncbi:MAG TPA: hypothetical protein VFW05_01970 [Verrucomicrobiae bacterium]|nr:hypothetical protein [Verrucomicrobiae bacterium]
MKVALGCLCWTASILLLTGCRTVGARSGALSKADEKERQGRWHTVEIQPAKNVPYISTWQKFNPVWWFGNVDDPVPPTWFRPEEKGRTFKWHLRNPFHNFAFYVIGIADKPHVRSGRFPRRISNPDGGWNFAVARRRIVYLPFVAYNHGRFDFYFGWRTRGNFGGKINFNAKRPPKTERENSKPLTRPSATLFHSMGEGIQSTEPSDNSDLPASGP